MAVPEDRRTRYPRGRSGRRPSRGISLVELIVVLAIIGIVGLFAVPNVAKIFRRMQCQTGLAGITRAVNSARLNAIRGVSGATSTAPPAPVVILVGTGGDGQQLHLLTFVDTDQDNTLEPGERVLDDVLFPDRLVFWKKDGTKGSLTEGAPLGVCPVPNPARAGFSPRSSTQCDCLVFLPTGGIAAAGTAPTKDAGRGIYFADRDGLNYFRVTINSITLARPVAEKWVSTSAGYTTAGWVFK